MHLEDSWVFQVALLGAATAVGGRMNPDRSIFASIREPGGGQWLLLVGLGCLLGALNSASNHGLVPGHVYVSKVVGNDWTWLLAA